MSATEHDIRPRSPLTPALSPAGERENPIAVFNGVFEDFGFSLDAKDHDAVRRLMMTDYARAFGHPELADRLQAFFDEQDAADLIAAGGDMQLITQIDGECAHGPITWAEFCKANCDDGQLPEILEALKSTGFFRGGGGAAPEFIVRVFNPNFAGTQIPPHHHDPGTAVPRNATRSAASLSQPLEAA